MKIKIFQILALLALTACGAKSNGLSYDPWKDNRAVLFGSPNGLSGVKTDIRELQKMFSDEAYGFGELSILTNENASAVDIIASSASAAEGASTLIWYFSGHGSPGSLLAVDREFTFSEVADKIIEKRGRPLDRLIVMIDSCFSGSFVDGKTPIIGKANLEDPVAIDVGSIAIKKCFRGTIPYGVNWKLYADVLYKEAFVFASSTKDQTSADLGKEKGGAFTYALRMSIAESHKENPELSFMELAKKTQKKTEYEGDHNPVFNDYPKSKILDDKFFIYGFDK